MPPNELMRLDRERMRKPDVNIVTKQTSVKHKSCTLSLCADVTNVDPTSSELLSPETRPPRIDPIKHPLRSRIRPQDAHRCGQPGQQHGRCIPSLSSEHTLSTCCRLVSSFLTDMVQQIHSSRASGVMSSHAARACASDPSAVRRSSGRSCSTPAEIRTVAILGYLASRQPSRTTC